MCEKRGERGRCSVAGFSWIGGRIYRVDNAVERKEGIDGRSEEGTSELGRCDSPRS